MNRFYFLLSGFLFFSSLALAQPDSNFLLIPERLEEKDIQSNLSLSDEVQVISALRKPADKNKQPYNVWVVTADDILRYGFITLADVLRAAPGIRVSQPGNAVEGETFLMRGLSGNRYVKILINDIPIKPGAVPGMPIGAQLPIRQAARIEVMYGAAGAIYGAEACAGVVNIILKETERPVFTQADLSFSLNYASMDLMFGGKLGSDKNILRYSLYGSNTVREKLDIYDDLSIYSIDPYVPLNLSRITFANSPNYLPFFEQDGTEHARLSQLAQESRLFGLTLAWKGWRFNYNRMGRVEPSMLGLNPLSQSYANPSNRLIEKQQTFSLSFRRRKNYRTVLHALQFSNYNINGTSSSTYLFDRGSLGQYLAWQNAGATFDYIDSAFNLYSRMERYSVAGGIDLRLESRFQFQLSRRFSLDLGTLLAAQPTSLGLWQYHKVPQISGIYVVDGRGSPVYPSFVDNDVSNLFGQLHWNGKKLQLNAGLGYGYDLFELDLFEPFFRGGVHYQIDSTWSIRANAGNGNSQASAYHLSQTYIYEGKTGKPANPYFNLPIQDQRERFKSAELAVRRKPAEGFDVEASFFWQQTDNLFRNGLFSSFKLEDYNNPGDSLLFYYYGHYNTPGRAMQLYGVQALIRQENREGFSFSVTGQRRTQVTSRMEFYIQYARGKEWLGYQFSNVNDVLNYPRWHTQFRTFYKLNQDFEMMLASNRQTAVQSKAVGYKAFYQLQDRPLKHNTFRSWDLQLRAFLSKQFTVYMFVQNVFNRKIYGIDATGTPEDLIYNPQPGRFVRVGVNYNMN